MLSRVTKKKIKQMSFERIKDQLSPEALCATSLKGFDSYTRYLIKRYRKMLKRDQRKLKILL